MWERKMRHTLSLAATRVFPSDDILILLMGTSSSGTYPLSVSVPDMNNENATYKLVSTCIFRQVPYLDGT